VCVDDDDFLTTIKLVCLSGSALVSISEVTPRQARLVLGWVIVCGPVNRRLYDRRHRILHIPMYIHTFNSRRGSQLSLLKNDDTVFNKKAELRQR